MSEISTVSEALVAFLKQVPINFAKDLTSRFNVEMETQININPTHGDPVYKGTTRVKNTYQVVSEEYGTYQYFPIRIPRNAWSDPNYSDPPVPYPIHRHIEGMGMTGWNWKKRRSLWVGFDIDSITDHAIGIGISEEDMKLVREKACQIPWVKVRRSTGGNGIHLYAELDCDEEIENHHVHSALGRAVLGMMSKEVGFDFRANTDCMGGNMWVWHRKISEHNRGLEIIKDNEDFCPPLPANWRDNEDVVRGKSSKVRVRGVGDGFESKSSSRSKVPIDDIHKEIENRIEKLDYTIMWVPDYWCWQTHTKALQDLHDEYPGEYKGYFKTLSQGNDPGEPNCFIFPMPDGGMRVVRFQKGTREHESWTQGNDDWTSTYFNVSPSLREVASIYGGNEDPDGKGWVFTDFGDVVSTLGAFGEDLSIDQGWLEMFGQTENRNIVLRPNKQDQLVIEMDKKKDEKAPKGWITKGRKYIKLFANTVATPIRDDDDSEIDTRVRALVDYNNEFSQWALINDQGVWVQHPKDNIRSALRIWANGDGEDLLGKLIIKNWKIVNVPFQPEYLGDRQWNKDAPQFAVQPSEPGLPHTHWDLVLNHCGQDLDDAVRQNQWCNQYGINSGADYLTYWIAFMMREPYKKLPYLFFYGPQNSGKSTLYEAISMLMTRGVVNATQALENPGGFNGELAGSVLCVIEEKDLTSKKSMVYNRLKDWTMSNMMLIHPKNKTPYMILNTTHWMQFGNTKNYVPIFPGDTRVVVCYVPYPDGPDIPRDTLRSFLAQEAPSFLRTLLDLKLPPPPGRTRLPILSTDSKRESEEDTENAIDNFIKNKCYFIPGACTKYSDFYDAIDEWMPNDQKFIWTRNKVLDELRVRQFGDIVLGRALNNVVCLGNLSLQKPLASKDYGSIWVRHRDKIVRKQEL